MGTIIETIFSHLCLSAGYAVGGIIALIVVIHVSKYVVQWDDLFKEDSPKFIKIFLVFWVAVFCFSVWREYWGETYIGSPFERGQEYRAVYYVNAFPEMDRMKNYRVPADIIVDNHADAGEGSCRYLIKRLYFPN